MNTIHFNDAGNLLAAVFFFSLPLVLVVVGLWTRGREGESRRWRFARRTAYLPVMLPLLLYGLVVYRWLFHDQFYWLTVEREGVWQLEYCLPGKTRTIRIADIAEIQAVSGDLWTYRQARIRITTREGERFTSAQVSLHDKDDYLNLLETHRQAMAQAESPRR